MDIATLLQILLCVAHRSPPVDQQHSGEKIVLSSSDVNEYTGSILVRTISRIVNPTRKFLNLFHTSYRTILLATCRYEGSK